jgi:peptidyl-prolyl cis-trans isomerase D
MTKTIRVAALAALTLVAACEGFKEAMTAHVDVAARAGSQELSVQRLSELMGKAQVPLRKEVAQSIADVWINYQLLGQAAARSDSLADTTVIDQAMWPVYAQSKLQKWLQKVSATWPIDTSNLEQKFNEGPFLAGSHILFSFPQPAQGGRGGDTVATREVDATRSRAEAVLRQTTQANFAAMAKRHGSDGTKDIGGNLGVWTPGRMVPAFDSAMLSLKPGQIGPLVRTQFGYHIVKRNTYAEAKDAFRAAYDSMQRFRAESAFVTGTEQSGNVQIRPNAAKVVKEVAVDPQGRREDRTVIATSKAGEYRATQVARWLTGAPNPEQTRIQIQQAPDSLIPNFVKFLVRNELFLRQADSAKIELEPSEKASIRQAFRAVVVNAWTGLRVAPTMLEDSAKTVPEKERLAAARIDSYLDRLLQQQEQFIEIAPPLGAALRQKYEGKANAAGLDRALQAAEKIRATADSARAAQQPKSAVPMPGSPPDTGATKKNN